MSMRDFAKELATGSRLFEGREKGDTKELIGQIVTINDCDFFNMDEGFYVFTVKEHPKKFFFAGMVFILQI